MSPRSLMRAVALAAVAALAAGCGTDATAPIQPSVRAASYSPVPVTLAWQEHARSLVAANRLSAPATGRMLAALSVAQHRALRAAEGEGLSGEPLGAMGFGPGGRDRYEARRGAVAGASAQLLTFFFPAASGPLEQRLVEQAASGPGAPHPEFARGVEIGRAQAEIMVEHVKNDGFTKPWTGTVPVGPGMWIPTTLPPGAATLGAVTPYFMSSGAQFRPAPPPAFGSEAFAADVAEVLSLTQNITPEQLAFARQWDYSAGTYTPVGYWNDVAAGYVGDHALDERAATEVFALMHAAVFDALIACWEAKYHYWTIRPSQAEPAITLAFTLPNFPAYPSGHSCVSSSAATVLASYFPDRAVELGERVTDAGLSRMLAGIHYRFDVTAGKELGKSVAQLALELGAP